jgi:hypothetical protein
VLAATSGTAYWAAAAATVSATVGVIVLWLTIRSRRPRIEVHFQRDPAGGAVDYAGQPAMVFTFRIDNVGSVPVSVRIRLQIDGHLVGRETDPMRLVSPGFRTLSVMLPVSLFEQVEQGGGRLEARIRFRRWPVKPATLALGEIKTV